MSRAERLFFVTALYGIALHVVARGAPLWLKIAYVIALTGGALCAVFGIHKTTNRSEP